MSTFSEKPASPVKKSFANSKKAKQASFYTALLPLAACGGGGGGGEGGGANTPAPAPAPSEPPDFTENPANVFISTETSGGSILAMANSDQDLTVTGSPLTYSRIETGSGNDTITAPGDFHHEIWAGAGDDVITAGDETDLIEGGPGADIIDGGSVEYFGDWSTYENSSAAVNVNLTTGVNTGGEAEGDILINIENIIGSDFNDFITGDGNNNRFIGGPGGDTFDGADGIDTVAYLDSPEGVTIDLLNQRGSGGDAEGDRFFNIETVIGSQYADIMRGDNEDNYFSGSSGDDVFYGRDGDDSFSLEARYADLYYIHGGYYGSGNNIVYGGNGDDGVFDGGGNDIFYGGDGNDTFRGGYTASNSPFSENGGGDDNIYGENGADFLLGGAGNDHIDGGPGDDLVSGGPGADTLIGGTGIDTLDYQDAYQNGVSGININLNTNSASGGLATGDTISGFENVIGTDFNDIITGTDGSNIIEGRLGHDTINGLGGDDFIFITHNEDNAFVTVDGGAGYDVLTARSYDNDKGIFDFNLSEAGYSNIEAIDLFRHGSTQVLTLDVNAVIGVTDADNILKIHGSNNDIITTDGGWTFTGVEHFEEARITYNPNSITPTYLNTIDYIAYLTYTNSGATLMVSAEFGTINGLDTPANFVETAANQFEAVDNSGGWFQHTDFTTSNGAVVTGKDGDDIIIANGSALFNVFGGAGDDFIMVGSNVNRVEGGEGADTMVGYSGNYADALLYTTSDAGVTVNLETGFASGGHAEGDIIIDFEDIFGSAFDDVLTGNAEDSWLKGEEGNDILNGGAGVDVLEGGDGNDIYQYHQVDGSIEDRIYDSGGTDTLQFFDDTATAGAYEIDLSDVDVLGIEIIDFASIDANSQESVTLTIQDVLNITNGGPRTLRIDGFANDTVTSTGEGWVQGADQVIDSETYHTYTAGGATLLIDEDITQTIT